MKKFFLIFNLLNKKQTKSAIALFFLILVAIVFETLSIGVVLPFLEIFLGDNIFLKYSFLQDLSQKFEFLKEFSSPDQSPDLYLKMLFFACFLIFVIYATKSIILTISNFFQLRFIKNIEVDWVKKLFNYYLNEDYSFYLKKNSAILFRNISQCSVSAQALKLIILLISEILVLAAVSVMLLIINPKITLIIFLFFFVISFLIYIFTKRNLQNWGKDRHHADGQVIKSLQQGFGGIKDIKLQGNESFFLERYINAKYIANQVQFKKDFLLSLPKIWIEFIAIISIFIFLFLSQVNLENRSSIIPLLGIFVAASFRLMPSINRILNSLQNLKYNLPVIQNITEEFSNLKKKQKRNNESIKFEFNHDIKIENLNFDYEKKNKLVLKNINLKIHFGEFVGFIGPSGSGKTTLIDNILGLLNPIEGSILVDGANINKNFKGWQKNIGYIPQKVYLTDDTIINNIAFGIDKNNIDEESVRSAVKLAQLEEHISNLPEGLNTFVGERGVRLSGGQLQRIGIARALYFNPQLLVLDESTNSLDNDTEKKIMESIRKLKGKRTIIVVAHRLSTVEYCDKLFNIENGSIIKTGNFKDIFGENYKNN